MIKLTHRQEKFIQEILDIYHKSHEPFHYSLVAEYLGLSKYTAYDMLRLLEEKGYVEAVYETHEGRPGRASILFQPTEKARQTFQKLAGNDVTDWEVAKARVIHRIRAEELEDPSIAQEVLAKLPSSFSDEVVYCASVIGNLLSSLSGRGRHKLMDYYASFILALSEQRQTSDLRLLPAFLLGMSVNDDNAPEITEKYFDDIRRYETLFEHMDKKARLRLAGMLKRLLSPLQGE